MLWAVRMTTGKSLDMAQANRTDRTIPTDPRVGLEVPHSEIDLVALHQTAIAMSPTEPPDVARGAPTVAIAGEEMIEAALFVDRLLPHADLPRGVVLSGEAHCAGSRRDGMTEIGCDLREEALTQGDDPGLRSIETAHETALPLVVPPLLSREPTLTVVASAPPIDVATIASVLLTLDVPHPLANLPSALPFPPATHHRDHHRALTLLDEMTVLVLKLPFLFGPSLDPHTAVLVPGPLDHPGLLLAALLLYERHLPVQEMVVAVGRTENGTGAPPSVPEDLCLGVEAVMDGVGEEDRLGSVPSTPISQAKPFNPPKGPAAENNRPNLAQQLIASMPPLIPGGKMDSSHIPVTTGVLPELQSHMDRLKEEEEKLREEKYIKEEKLRKSLAAYEKGERETKVMALRTELAEQSFKKFAGEGLGGAAF
ncbi:hypothetical protein EKO27_g1473 [Xylaria grammica]|uniref:Uncharacterized protein n=1 Tax=Xylaria grammica TaxID=363999 RepID=A0A439DGV9_9PEZI|nr:hypothetical protein EKO27_g1473 [Xylaria grammica]